MPSSLTTSSPTASLISLSNKEQSNAAELPLVKVSQITTDTDLPSTTAKPMISSEFSIALQKAAHQRLIKQYREIVLKQAEIWGTDDLPTVRAILGAIIGMRYPGPLLDEPEGGYPASTDEVYFHRVQMRNDPNVDSLIQRIEPVPFATAGIRDDTHLLYNKAQKILIGTERYAYDLRKGGLNCLAAITSTIYNTYGGGKVYI